MTNIYSKIKFIKKQKSKPYYESSAITGMVPKLYFKTESKKVLIKDLRLLKPFTLEENGFILKNFAINLDEKDINNNYRQYRRDLSTLLSSFMSFKHIEIFDITRRSNKKKGAFNKDGNRQPAERAHVDYTIDSGPKRAEEILIKKYPQYKKYRILQLNVWKPISDEVLSSPLAIADARSIKKKDLIATDQIFPDRVGEIYHLAYNKGQRWYWVSKMKKNEFLIFKGWDSLNSKNIIRFTPHTSFDLKKQNIEKFPRESVEARVFLII